MRDGSLWAITAFFNPARYQVRRANFRRFRAQLGVPLLAVELTFGREPELEAQDAEVLLALTEGDLMWQKERLLNLALQSLPGSAQAVAWIDADVLFADARWPELAARELERVPVAQLFRRVRHLAASGETLFSQDSTAYRLRTDPDYRISPAVQLRSKARTGTGLAWVARREALAQGFFDRSIIGGGDSVFLCALAQEEETAIARHVMNSSQQEAFRQWAAGIPHEVRGNFGFVDTEIAHLWHGDYENRRASERHRGLADLGFDPMVDLRLLPNGAWAWATEKPELHAYVHDYFLQRHEDQVPS